MFRPIECAVGTVGARIEIAPEAAISFHGIENQLFFDQIIEAAIVDGSLRQAAAVNPGDKFELVFKNLLEALFVERMDQKTNLANGRSEVCRTAAPVFRFSTRMS